MKEMDHRLETIERAVLSILQRLNLTPPTELAEHNPEPVRMHFPAELLANFSSDDDDQ